MKTYKWVFKETLFISQKLGITQMSINRWMNKKKNVVNSYNGIRWNLLYFKEKKEGPTDIQYLSESQNH